MGNVNPQSQVLSNLFAYLNLSQFNRIANVLGGYLDRVLSNIETEIVLAEQPLLSLDKYHPALTFEFGISQKRGETLNFDYEYYDFKNGDFGAINDFLGLYGRICGILIFLGKISIHFTA